MITGYTRPLFHDVYLVRLDRRHRRRLSGNEPGRKNASKQQRLERRQATWRLAPILMKLSRQTFWRN